MSLNARLRSTLDDCRTVLDRLDELMHLDDAGGLRPRQVADKFAAEAALLLHLAAETPDRALHAQVERLAIQLVPLCRTRQNVEMLSFGPQYAVAAGLGHALLGLMGEKDEAFDQVFRAALTSDFVFGTDRPNFRQLEVAWLRRLVEPTDRTIDRFVEMSVLNQPMNPLYMRREDGYAYTHAAMYVTDFGRRAAPETADPEARRLLITQCLCWCLVRQDWDLLAEFAIAALILDCADVAMLPECIGILDMLHDCAGGFPPAWIAPGTMPPRQREATDILRGYHTLFVYGILCTVRMKIDSAESGVMRWRTRESALLGSRIFQPTLEVELLANMRLMGHCAGDRLADAYREALLLKADHPVLRDTLATLAHRLEQTVGANRYVL